MSFTTKRIRNEIPKPQKGDFVLSTRIISTTTNQNISILGSSTTLGFPSTNKNQGKLLL